jgi:hypothetical protein
MTEKELTQLGLLEEFSITELEQRLEFEAWCDSCPDVDTTCPNTTCPTNEACPPINNCGGGGGGGGCGSIDPSIDETCIIEAC